MPNGGVQGENGRMWSSGSYYCAVPLFYVIVWSGSSGAFGAHCLCHIIVMITAAWRSGFASLAVLPRRISSLLGKCQPYATCDLRFAARCRHLRERKLNPCRRQNLSVYLCRIYQMQTRPKNPKEKPFSPPKKCEKQRITNFCKRLTFLFCLAGGNRDFVAVVVAWHFWQNPADWQVNESLPRHKAKGYWEEFRQAIDATASEAART